MWFEIIPCAMIIYVGMAGPHYAAYLMNKLALGNSYRRTMYSREDSFRYLRDWRIGGSPYKVIGLEGIPDANEKQ